MDVDMINMSSDDSRNNLAPILVATSSQDDRERRLFTVTNSEYERKTFRFRFQNQISDLDSRFKFQI